MDPRGNREEVAYNLAHRVDPNGHGGYGAGDIEGREGIRGVLGCDQGTKQDTQGQHSRQQRAVHDGPSWLSMGGEPEHEDRVGQPYPTERIKYRVIDMYGG
jgi:hypothetical protein